MKGIAVDATFLEKALGGAAAIIVACGTYVAARGGKAKDRESRPSLPMPAPRAPLDSQPDSIEARLSRAEARLAACVEDVQRVEQEIDEMRTHLHAVETAAIERLSETKEKVAELTGALSARWGKR